MKENENWQEIRYLKRILEQLETQTISIRKQTAIIEANEQRRINEIEHKKNKSGRY